MKTELHTTMAGETSIEVIAETDVEFALFERAWKLRGYPRGNGKSTAPGGGGVGFFIPLFNMTTT